MVSTREVGDRNERLETDVSFKRNDPDFLPNLFNLSLSRLRARFPASTTTTRSTPRTRARKRETERFATSKKRYPAAFLERLWFHARSFRRDLKRRRRQERRRMVEASEKRTLTMTHQKQDLRVFLPQPQRGEDVVKPIERPHVLWWSRFAVQPKWE